MLKKNYWLVLKVLIFISIAVPLGITTYEIIFLGRESVVFLGDYPAAVGFTVIIYYALLLVAGIIWIVIQLKSVFMLKNEIEKNELVHLKRQVNPHFFFNMLNNLYGIVDQDTEKAKKLILSLSEMMRYGIYEGEKKSVLLADEVNYLKQYIALHQLRYHKKVEVSFSVDTDDDKLEIMPLTFIILVENAFKHGVETLRDNAFVNMKLKANKGIIQFEIVNNYAANSTEAQPGIGIKNLKRRLALAYPKQHQLLLTDEDTTYKAFLEIKNG